MSTPRVSIGMPVYNAERFLPAALAGLTNQTLEDFEIIICDNASTDRTSEMCRAFAAVDSRIQFHRHEANLGAARNYNSTFQRATAPYFKWAAHDDVCDPTFLERCVAELDEDPTVVLCHTLSRRIDEHGKSSEMYSGEPEAEQPQPHRRFLTMITAPHLCISIFGVMRRSVLAMTPRHGDWVGADRNLLAELALHGRIRLVQECLFGRRDHAGCSIRAHTDERNRLEWFDPEHKSKHSYPTWRRLREYIASIRRAPLSPADRARCYAQMLHWAFGHHQNGKRMLAMLAGDLGLGKPLKRPG